MQGETRARRGGRLVESETTIIRRLGGRAVYEASPGGATPVTFTETARGARQVTFANPGHDYPQRIRYWRDGPELVAEISLADGGRPMRWRYRRTALHHDRRR